MGVRGRSLIDSVWRVLLSEGGCGVSVRMGLVWGTLLLDYETKPFWGWQRHRLHAGATAPTARLGFPLTARFSSPTRLTYPMLRLLLLEGLSPCLSIEGDSFNRVLG